LRKFSLVLLSIVLLIGCSSKEEKALMKEYKNKKTYFKMLQKTEKILLSDNNTTKAVLTATYLRAPHEKLSNKKDETFIIGLYLEDEEINDIKEVFGLRDKNETNTTKLKVEMETVENIFDSNETHIINATIDDVKNNNEAMIRTTNSYTLMLNGKKAIYIEKLNDDDPRLKKLSLISEWSTYALVKFEHVSGKQFQLIFDSAWYGKGILAFSKVAKYVTTKKSF